MQIASLGIDQTGRKGIGVTQEEHVGQGDISPVETCQMQPHQEDRQGIDQALGRVRTQITGE